MAYNIYFDICALLIQVLIIFMVFYRNMTKTSTGKCFLSLLVISTITTLLDIFSVAKKFNYWSLVTFEYLYLAFRVATSIVFLFYLVSLTESKTVLLKKKWPVIVLAFPYIVLLGILISNSVSHLIFFYDFNEEIGLYKLVAGKLYFMLFVVSFTYYVIGLFYITYYRKLINKDRLLCLYLIYPLNLIAVIIQFIFPQYLLEMFATALALLFIIITVERPEQVLDPDNGLRKYSTFVSDSYKAMILKKSVTIICVNVINFTTIRKLLSHNELIILKQEISRIIDAEAQNYVKRRELYSLGQGRFLVVTENDDFYATRKLANSLRIALNDKFKVKGSLLELLSNVMIFNCPDDIKESQMSVNVIESFCKNDHIMDYLYDLSSIKNKKDILIVNNIDTILERGFTNKSYHVYYQPIFDTENERFNSAEALLRLEDVEFGFISPAIFIPYAEKNGMIHKIGYYVLEEVCKFIASDAFLDLGIEYIEVNLSTVQCMKDDFYEKLIEIIEKYKISPEKINLEITETSDQFSENLMKKNIEKLHEKGFTFSLDDYGTGYSNLTRISLLPLRIIKIDKTFVDQMSDVKMQGILKHTINMIKSMNVKIVVEGVETKEALQLFKKYNCEYIQGYYFSRPLPLNKYIEFINSNK